MTSLPRADELPTRLLTYSVGILVLGLLGILGGVTLVEIVPATVWGGLLVFGYVLVYVGFLASLYADLRGGCTASTNPDRPLDGESG